MKRQRTILEGPLVIPKKVSIRPRDFNAEKQGIEVTKIGTTIDSEKNDPKEIVVPGGDDAYLGEIILSNSLEEDVNVSNVELQLDFLEGKAGPEENFSLEIKSKNETINVDITREKKVNIKFQELLLEAGDSESFRVYIKAREDESYLLHEGVATVFLSDIEAYFYDPKRNDNEIYLNDIPSISPAIYKSRYLGTFKFSPFAEEIDTEE